MYYRPREKRRHPFLRFILLVAATMVLIALLGIYVGYFKVEIPTLAEQLRPTPTPTRPAPLYIADGDTYFAKGKLNEAIAAYEQAIQLDPDNDIPYIRQARLLIYTGDTGKAVDRAAQAVLLNPTSPENLAYYCRALDWETQYSAAFDACSCATELDPNYAEAYAFLSEIYADQADWVSSRTTAQQALDANFQSMDAQHNMGYALETQGRYAEAVEFYENAIKLAPNLAPLYLAAGRTYYWLGDFETAADRFKEAIRLNPSDARAYDRLGWTYQTNGETTRAIDALEQGIGVDPTYSSAWGHLGLVYYTRQNFEAAVEYLPTAIELAEDQFLRRVRQVEIFTEVQTLTGPESIPILRGRFSVSNKSDDLVYEAEIHPISYESSFAFNPEEPSCAASIVQSIQNQPVRLSPVQSLDFTEVFSQATGIATVDLATGNLLLDIDNMPQPETTPYEIKVSFWPDRVDSVGYVQPDGSQKIKANIHFEEKLSAPIEYYYTLGLAYVYMDPPMCEEAKPWLLKALEIDSSAYDPAWAGVRDCSITNTPPTPVPTPTPLPDEEKGG